MRPNLVTKLAQPWYDAFYVEASRRAETPGLLLEEFFEQYWSDFVGGAPKGVAS